MGFPVPHDRRSDVHPRVQVLSKILTQRHRPWGARFAEIPSFEKPGVASFSKTFLDPRESK